MLPRNRIQRTSSLLTTVAVPLLLVLLTVLALTPPSSARARLDVSLQFSVPSHIYVNDAPAYEPYYVGRVFYQPLRRWRVVYAFPVPTVYGVTYLPFVYDDGRIVCRDFIPGPQSGYGRLVVDGRGYYDPGWNSPSYAGAPNQRDASHSKARNRRDRDHGSWDRHARERSDSGKHGRRNGHHR